MINTKQAYLLAVLIAFCAFTNEVSAQFLLLYDSFDVACAGSNYANSYSGSYGQWSVAPSGPNAPTNSNNWFSSNRATGSSIAPCAGSCSGVSGTDGSLHIGVDNPTLPAIDTFATYDFNNPTAKRAISPQINTTNRGNIRVEFDYFLGGVNIAPNPTDYCELQYSVNGTGGPWTAVQILPQTSSATCGSAIQYQPAIFNLPSNADNVTDLRIAFDWVNDAGGVGTNPSVAIDEFRVFADSGAIDANFSISDTTPCNGQLVDFSDLSLGDTLNSWTWTFQNANTPSSTAQNPGNIVWTTNGTHTVKLVITDTAGQTDSIIRTVVVNNCPPPDAKFGNFPIKVCLGQGVNFSDSSSNAPVQWFWDFDVNNSGVVAPATSTLQNPIGISFNSAGCYPVKLVVTNAVGIQDSITVNCAVEVVNCTQPVAKIYQSDSIICVGQQLVVADSSSGSPTIIQWNFGPNATPNTSTTSTSVVSYSAPGIYPIGMRATNADGTDSTTAFIEVINCPTPVPNFTSSGRTGCAGDFFDFFDASTGATKWVWEFIGAVPNGSNARNPTNIVYSAPGLYTVKLTVSNAINGSVTTTQTGYILINDCEPPRLDETTISAEARKICIGQCVTFNIDTTNIDTFAWSFPGVDSIYQDSSLHIGNVVNIKNPTVCYNQLGKYDIGLFAENQFGSRLFPDGEDYIEVVPYPRLFMESENSLILIGESQQLQVEGDGDVFEWFPQDSTILTCLDCIDPIATPQETTTFFIHHRNELGCEVRDSVKVFVQSNYNIGLPNAFSPNGDFALIDGEQKGVNNIFIPRGNGIGTIDFRVYNRYGVELFQSTDPTEGWDGTYNSDPMPPGIYIYTVEVVFLDGNRERLQGDVTLIR